MANYIVSDTDLESIADAIRSAGDTSESLEFPSGFVNAIEEIPSGGGGGDITVEQLSVTSNGTYTASTGKAYSPVVVNVSSGNNDTFAPQNRCGTKITDIPDLSKLDRTGQVIYFIVDTSKRTVPLYSKFGIRPSGTGVLTITRGYLGNNGFVGVQEEVVASAAYYSCDLGDDGHRFWIFRFTSTGTITRYDLPRSITGVFDNLQMPLCAVYGNAPLTNIVFGSFRNLLIFDMIGINYDTLVMQSIVGALDLGSIIYIKIAGTGKGSINLCYNSYFLQEIDLSGLDMTGTTSMAQAFRECRSLTKVKLGTIASNALTAVNGLFQGAGRIDSIDLSNVNMSSVTNTSYMFANMGQLTTIIGWPSTLAISFNLRGEVSGYYNDSITHDSLMVVINALPTVETTQTLTIGEYNLARLSAEEIAVATAKGWTVV